MLNSIVKNTLFSRNKDGSFGQVWLLACLAWNVLIAVFSVFFTAFIIANEEAFPVALRGLGAPVRLFVALVGLVPFSFAVRGFIGLWQVRQGNASDALKSNMRMLHVILYFLVLVGGFIYLISAWNIFFGFEFIVNGVMANPTLTLGFPIAYVLFWLGSRFNEFSAWRGRLEMLGLGLGGITLVVILLTSGFLDGLWSIVLSFGRLEVWLGLAVVLISARLAWELLYAGKYFKETPQQRQAWQGWAMLAPNAIGFGLFFAGPLLLSLYLSFTDSTAGAIPNVIGINNYTSMLAIEFQTQTDLSANPQAVLSFGYRELGSLMIGESRLVVGARDPLFWLSLRNTLMYCLLLLPLAVIPAIALSLILNSSLPGMKFYRAIYFLPSVAAVVGTALIWRWLYDPVIGFFNYFISGFVGFLNGIGVPATDPAIKWLSDPGMILFAIVFLGAWQVIGYNTVLFLAGLQGIPKELYEAASIDGANGWRSFWYVTLPMLRPTTFFVMITTIVTGLQVFNEPYALIPTRPLPTQATTSVFYLYTQGFSEFQFGYASAVAWFLFIIIFSITLIQFRMQRNNPYE